MPAKFPFVAIAGSRGDSSLAPIMPLELQLGDHAPVQVHGLLDSGAAVNVLPYRIGISLGALWEAQTTRVTLTGNLAAQEARALLLQARIADFAPVPLVFAWTRAENIPLLLGQVNFFDAFDICFHRSRRTFEVQLAK